MEGDDDSWYMFRVMLPRFTQLSEEGEVVSETCNNSENDLEVEFSYTQVNLECKYRVSY